MYRRSFSIVLVLVLTLFAITGCTREKSTESEVSEAVERQQDQLTKLQPVPFFDYSLERDLLIQLYQLRNMKATTHSVWRSDFGTIEGDCPSLGFGLPYDTSLTNPVAPKRFRFNAPGVDDVRYYVVEQPEPNGIFASKNTNATWIMCVGSTGSVEPHYTESRVTAYPYAVKVDYDSNRVTRSGEKSITIKASQ